MILRILIVFCIFTQFSGCFSPEKKVKSSSAGLLDGIDGGSIIPANANTIFIKNFSSSQSNKNINSKLMIKISNSLSMDGRLAVIDKGSDPDLILSGVLTGYEKQLLEFDNSGRPIKKRARITALVKLKDNKSKKTIFVDKNIQFFKIYSDTQHPIISDLRAKEYIIDGLGKRIVSKIITGWYSKYLTDIEKGKK